MTRRMGPNQLRARRPPDPRPDRRHHRPHPRLHLRLGSVAVARHRPVPLASGCWRSSP